MTDFGLLLSSIDISFPWDVEAHLAFRNGLENITRSFVDNQQRWDPLFSLWNDGFFDLFAGKEPELHNKAKHFKNSLLLFSKEFESQDESLHRDSESRTEEEDDIESGKEKSNLTENGNDSVPLRPSAKIGKDFNESGRKNNLKRETRTRLYQHHPTYIPVDVMQSLMMLPRMIPSTRKAKGRESSSAEEDDNKHERRPPVIFLPEQTTKCVRPGQLSSFGFISFMIAVANVVMVGRRLQRLLQLKQRLTQHVEHSQNRIRRWADRGIPLGNSCPEEGAEVKVRGILTVMTLIDLWKVSLSHHNPACAAYKFCATSGYLSEEGSVATAISNVGIRAAAHLLEEATDFSPEYLLLGALKGREDITLCKEYLRECQSSD
ncbi:hypothetical protein SK128_020752 [Halocaridina rubra]|uniref:Uncharacterized protein n=1 Tax=Halocaridina rubra TaxID=373956 RepID=A0AAN8X3I2_HALRR